MLPVYEEHASRKDCPSKSEEPSAEPASDRQPPRHPDLPSGATGTVMPRNAEQFEPEALQQREGFETDSQRPAVLRFASLSLGRQADQEPDSDRDEEEAQRSAFAWPALTAPSVTDMHQSSGYWNGFDSSQEPQKGNWHTSASFHGKLLPPWKTLSCWTKSPSVSLNHSSRKYAESYPTQACSMSCQHLLASRSKSMRALCYILAF